MYFWFFLIVICFLICTIKEKNIYNPGTIFFAIWSVISFLFFLNPYSLPTVSYTTLYVFLLSVFCFGFGLFSMDLKNRKNRSKFKKNKAKVLNDFCNPFVVCLVQLFALVLYVYLALPGIRAVISGASLAYIRYTLRLSTLSSGINAVLLTYFATPILYFSIFYTCSILASGCKKKLLLRSSVFTMLMLLLELLTLGGRMSLLVSLASVMVAMFIRGSQVHKKKGKRKIVLLIITSVIIVSLIFTKMVISRGNDDPLKSFAIYLYGSIPFLDSVINSFMTGEYSYCFGFLSFQGFSSPIISLLGLSDIPFFENVDSVYKLIDSYIYFNGEIPFNSEIGFFGYFYLDGGPLFVALFSFIFGFISERAYIRIHSFDVIQTHNICLYMLCLGAIVMSFIQFSFASVGYSLCIFLIIFLRKIKKK